MSYTEQYFMVQFELAKYMFYIVVGILIFVLVFVGSTIIKLAIEDLINKIKQRRQKIK